ncbi:MAG: queuosine precursor transporter [Sphaerochaetaceae bacterium]|nr:queuosine precursor transporter [Sphaerochaetaceae bacterium]MDC7248908.1 queuosine precursor transporter [Sphaerochaetaceae bacterium]
MNELLWAIMLIINFSAILLAYRVWGKLGLYLWIPISVIIANIQVTKTVNLFGLEATLGNIVYATGFLVTDILSECFSKKESRKAIGIGFFALICLTLMMQLAIRFEPASSDFVQDSMLTIFSFMPRLMVASLIAYFISNHHDIFAYEFWKKRFPSTKMIWLRNNASTLVSQLIDSIIFTFIAFYGVYSMDVLYQIVLSTYILKWIVAILDTPFLYLAKKWFDEGKIKTSI